MPIQTAVGGGAVARYYMEKQHIIPGSPATRIRFYRDTKEPLKTVTCSRPSGKGFHSHINSGRSVEDGAEEIYGNRISAWCIKYIVRWGRSRPARFEEGKCRSINRSSPSRYRRIGRGEYQSQKRCEPKRLMLVLPITITLISSFLHYVSFPAKGVAIM